MGKTTKELRAKYRKKISAHDLPGRVGLVNVDMDDLLRLIQDADRCAELEATVDRVGEVLRKYQAAYRDLERRVPQLQAVVSAAEKVRASGVLCDPGCCSEDCGCARLRMALDALDSPETLGKPQYTPAIYCICGRINVLNENDRAECECGLVTVRDPSSGLSGWRSKTEEIVDLGQALKLADILKEEYDGSCITNPRLRDRLDECLNPDPTDAP